MSTPAQRPVSGRPGGPARNAHALRRVRTLLFFTGLLVVTLLVILLTVIL